VVNREQEWSAKDDIYTAVATIACGVLRSKEIDGLRKLLN